MSTEILVDGSPFSYENTPEGIPLLIAARIAAAKRVERRVVHIHQGGTVKTYCGRPVERPDVKRTVSWEQAGEATCFTCQVRFRG
ncbi:MAG TPA: hypothetical protein VNN79_04645 [Actinomycetota bacterium]|nr:hypothetical protein [Actinomycetota bacterium]